MSFRLRTVEAPAHRAGQLMPAIGETRTVAEVGRQAAGLVRRIHNKKRAIYDYENTISQSRNTMRNYL